MKTKFKHLVVNILWTTIWTNLSKDLNLFWKIQTWWLVVLHVQLEAWTYDWSIAKEELSGEGVITRCSDSMTSNVWSNTPWDWAIAYLLEVAFVFWVLPLLWLISQAMLKKSAF